MQAQNTSSFLRLDWVTPNLEDSGSKDDCYRTDLLALIFYTQKTMPTLTCNFKYVLAFIGRFWVITND